MIKKSLNSLRILMVVLVGLVVLAAALYSAILLWFWRVNTVVGAFSAVSYKLNGQMHDLDKFRKLVGEIATASQLEQQGDSAGDGANWMRRTGVFNSNRLDLHISIESYPLVDDGLPNRNFNVNVYSSDSGKSVEWQQVSKKIERVLMPLVPVEKVVVQFDPAVYGACASEQRPEEVDTVCSFDVNAPVDFDALNKKIKLIRINGGKSPVTE